MIEFNKDGIMKAKKYPVNCVIRGDKCQPLILITYNECTFSANNRV